MNSNPHLFFFRFDNGSVAHLRAQIVALSGPEMAMEWHYDYVGPIDARLPPEFGPEFKKAFEIIGEVMNEVALAMLEQG